MLGSEMPIIQPRIHRVLHRGRADQPLDFTSKDDVRFYVAAAATDLETPRILRISSYTLSARDIAAAAMSEVTVEPRRTLQVGGVGSLGALIRLAKLVAPQPGAAFPPWQGVQYMRDMFSGRGTLDPLDNDRYPNIGVGSSSRRGRSLSRRSIRRFAVSSVHGKTEMSRSQELVR
jgi:hypothetical protein